MTAEEMWKESGLEGTYDAWRFGVAEDKLAELVLKGNKRATSSAFALYALDGEEPPKEGDYSIILDSKDQAVCIIRDVKVYVKRYCDIDPEYAAMEGEGNLSLDYWRQVHEPFFRNDMSSCGLDFTEDMEVLCEEFELIYP